MTIPSGALDSSPDALHRQLYFARRAARVVCVSEATRRDLLSSVEIPEDRAVVVPTGNLLPLFATRGAPVPGLPRAFFVFVGSRQARKNFDGTVRALVPLLKRPDGPCLVATGRLDLWERDLVADLGVADRVLGIDVDDAQLVTLYEHALGLLYPSFYEGFGLPVLEAMSLGCPVVTSNVSSLPEVAGDATLLVDPADYAALHGAAERLVDEPGLRASLAEAGRARAAQFSFDGMMRGLLEQLHAAAATQGR
jgi:glycosyltransferase involved in cell wall biosynthesis